MRATELQNYLAHPRMVIHARPISASMDADAQVIDLDVDVDLPQRPIYRINKTERLRVRFPANDAMPQVFALRKTFPLVPHTIVNGAAYPRQLCLYERSWSDERENWAPRPFVERIRRWLAGTADGTLHRPDQPLEPIMQDSPARVVLPDIPVASGKLCRIEHLFLIQRSPSFWIAQRQKPAWAPDAIATPVLLVQGPVAEHGIIRELPDSLGSLEKLLVDLGGSLVKTISTELVSIREELKKLTHNQLLLVLELPKMRARGGRVESVEHRAFLIGKEIGELFKVETVQVNRGGIWVTEKRELFEDVTRLAETKLMPLSVRRHLSSTTAAAMNGQVPVLVKTLAIGAGALGSQIVNNLWRGGFGEWTIVDADHIEPHNPARHLLNSDAVGFKKAYALSAAMDAVFPDSSAPSWIACDYLSPKADAEKLTSAINGADLILDFSASVVVERSLALDTRSTARRITAFLNQRGDESVFLAEDAKRTTDLFWLEVEYLRAVAFDARLRGHFDDMRIVAHRYGNGCRDISTTVPQDAVVLHAALLANHIRRATAKAESAAVVSRWSPETGAVVVINLAATTPITTEIAGWRVLIHAEAIRELVAQRAKYLPNETGGIVLGVVDRSHQTIAVVGMMPAPADSDAWPTSFIRGSNGLATTVSTITKRTLGNVIYLGEWHSHPEGCNARPSVPDLAAVAICTPNTRADGLPTLMLIIAAGELGVVLSPTACDEVHNVSIPLPQLT